MAESTLTAPAPLRSRDSTPASDAWALDPRLRHLNHGSFGAVPRAVLDQQLSLRREMEAAPVAWFPALPQRIAATRVRLARALDVSPETLVLVPNASAGASVVFGLELPAGAEVLVTDHGYGAVSMGAARAARRAHGHLRIAHVPLAAGEAEAFEAVWSCVTDRTALIVLDQVTSPTARRLPVGELCAAARRAGIATLVDAAHAPLMLPAPVAEADADYWVGNLHKFGCAPRGTAVLVARPEVSNRLYPLIDSWGGDLDYPERFDHQGTLDLTSWLAAPGALDFVEESFGWARVREYAGALAGWGQQVITDAFERASGEDCSVQVGLPVGPLRLVALPAGLSSSHLEANGLRDRLLAEAGIEAAFTCFAGRGYLRLSAHAYNTADDYADFADRAVPLLLSWAARQLVPVSPMERREQ